MPDAGDIERSANRIEDIRFRIAGQLQLVAKAEFMPLQLAFAIRQLKLQQDQLARLESAHAQLLGLSAHAKPSPVE